MCIEGQGGPKSNKNCSVLIVLFVFRIVVDNDDNNVTSSLSEMAGNSSSYLVISMSTPTTTTTTISSSISSSSSSTRRSTVKSTYYVEIHSSKLMDNPLWSGMTLLAAILIVAGAVVLLRRRTQKLAERWTFDWTASVCCRPFLVVLRSGRSAAASARRAETNNDLSLTTPAGIVQEFKQSPPVRFSIHTCTIEHR